MRDTNTAATLARDTVIVGSGQLPDILPSLALVGRLLAPGVYKWQLPVTGDVRVGATLRLQAHTSAVPTARIYKAMADNVSEKMGDTGASAAVAFGGFVDGTSQTKHITDLEGESVVILEITVPNGATATFDVAEYDALDESLAGSGGGGGGGLSTNDGSFALESGGHLANIDAEIGSHLANVDTATSAVSTATGAKGDAAYTDATGAAGGGIIQLLKGIFMKVAGVLSIAGNTVRVAASFTRPADFLAYAIGDAVNNNTTVGNVAILQFSNLVRVANGHGYITRVKIQSDNPAASLPAFRLHLYSGGAPTLTADNAAFITKWADRSLYLGYIDIGAGVVSGGAGVDTSFSSDGTMRYHVQGDASGHVYGLLEARGAYTPTSGENFLVTAVCEQN